MRKIKVAIAGAGFMGETHMNQYKRLQEKVEVLAIAEKNEEKRKSFSKKFNIEKTYDDFENMIEKEDFDVIDICLPTPLHKPAVISAFRNGKDVVVEKPIALTVKDSQEIIDEAEKYGRKLFVAHVLRFWDGYREIREFINANDFSFKLAQAKRFNEEPMWSEGLWIMNESMSGGIVVDLMIHDIDYLIWNFGKVKRVFSHGIKNKNNFHIFVKAFLEFESGFLGIVEGGYLNKRGMGLVSSFELYGDKSNVFLNDKVSVFENNGSYELEIKNEDGYYLELSHFIECIEKNMNSDIIPPNEALYSLDVSIKVRESLKKGKWIEV